MKDFRSILMVTWYFGQLMFRVGKDAGVSVNLTWHLFILIKSWLGEIYTQFSIKNLLMFSFLRLYNNFILSVSKELGGTTYPFMTVVCLRDNETMVVDRLQGEWIFIYILPQFILEAVWYEYGTKNVDEQIWKIGTLSPSIFDVTCSWNPFWFVCLI
jgi:hypothetical protein